MGYINQSISFQQFMKIKQAEDYIPVKDEVTKAVITDLISRAQRGVEKYNTT